MPVVISTMQNKRPRCPKPHPLEGTTTSANPIPTELSAAIEEEIARVFGMQDLEAERQRIIEAGERDVAF